MLKKQKAIKPLILLLYAAAVLIMSWLFAMQRINVCDYVSINGDFQSYNVFRRILNGQAPYSDFTNYIGMAPAIINMPFMVFGGSFAASLFFTNFTSCIIFCVSVFLVFYLITESLAVSCLISALLPKLVSSQLLMLLLGPKYGYIFTQRFEGLYTPSNSMRGVRAFLPFLFVLLALLAAKIYEKRKGAPPNIISALKSTRIIAALGLLQGAFIVWSNDYGFACIAASVFILIILQIFAHKQKAIGFIKNLGAYFICASSGLLLSAAIFTGGRPFAWFSAAAQTAEYQPFYFNGTAGKPVLAYLFTEPYFWLYTSLLCVLMLACLYLLIKGRAKNNTLYIVFILLSVIAATLIYICGGSGYNSREALEVYTIIAALALLAKGVLYLLRSYKKISVLIPLAILVVCTGYYSLLAVRFTPQKSGEYIPAFKGTSTFGLALNEAAKLTEGEEVFSLYATGLETVKNTFQPTGTDYIIHALGKEAQEKYAEKFVSGNYKYVQTPSMDIGVWLANQNWYFYRHLLANYERAFKTEYSWIWEKREAEPIKADVNIKINKISEYETEIICTSDNKTDFIADVLIDYDTSFANPWQAFLALGRKYLQTDTNVCFDSNAYTGQVYPGAGTEYIAVKMKNGSGTVKLTGVYGRGIKVNIKSAEHVSSVSGLYLN